MKTRAIKLCAVLLLCLPLPVSAEEMVLEVIPLQQRTTAEVIQILRPLIAPGGTVTGMNNQLIIKTTPSNLAEIKKILASLDHAPRRLLISVKQDSGGQIQSGDHAISGRYSSGDVSIGANSPGHPREGVVISGRDGEGNVIRYHGRESSATFDDRNTFTVQATEGYPAFIASGQSVPVTGSTAVVTPGGVIVQDTTEYVDASSGFYVLPRLQGDRVTLLIAPRLTRVTPGSAPIFDVQNVETTASGHLGEWIELGGVDQQFGDSHQGTISSSSARGNEQRSIYVKVVEIE